jgi:hypothetical protein
VALATLSAEDGFALLAERVGHARLQAEPRFTAELVDLCVGLPLALSIAAARAEDQPMMSVNDLVNELREERNRLDALDLGSDRDLSLRGVLVVVRGSVTCCSAAFPSPWCPSRARHRRACLLRTDWQEQFQDTLNSQGAHHCTPAH